MVHLATSGKHAQWQVKCTEGRDPRYEWVSWFVHGPGLALTTADKGQVSRLKLTSARDSQSHHLLLLLQGSTVAPFVPGSLQRHFSHRTPSKILDHPLSVHPRHYVCAPFRNTAGTPLCNCCSLSLSSGQKSGFYSFL